MLKFKIGDVVFVNGQWNVAEKCKVTDIIMSRNSKAYYQVQSIDNGGSFGSFEVNTFATKKDALFAFDNESTKKIAKYKEEIKDLKDLLQFPLDHCFDGDEYTDYDAMAAYKIRAKELTGITLEGD